MTAQGSPRCKAKGAMQRCTLGRSLTASYYLRSRRTRSMAAEAMEERTLAKGNADERNALRTQLPEPARQVTSTTYDTRRGEIGNFCLRLFLVITQGRSRMR